MIKLAPVAIVVGVSLALPQASCRTASVRSNPGQASDLAGTNHKVLPLNAEASAEDQVGEQTLALLMTKRINQLQVKQAKSNKKIDRPFHVKSHGCVEGEFVVNGQLPDDAKFGVFAREGARFPAWVRFSNAQSIRKSDKETDIRGLSVKLLSVPGRKVMEGEEDAPTQDFLAINQPVLFAEDVEQFMSFQLAMADQGLTFAAYMAGHPVLAARLLRNLRATDSVLTSPFWSTVPSMLGPRAIKFAFMPCEGQVHTVANDQPDNFLRDDLVARLKQQDACYTFNVQFQKDPVKQPVENPTVEWKETDTPLVPLGRLIIKAQDLTDPETLKQEAVCEQFVWNPWHALAAHRPIGGINRLRKSLMRNSQKFRGYTAPPREP